MKVAPSLDYCPKQIPTLKIGQKVLITKESKETETNIVRDVPIFRGRIIALNTFHFTAVKTSSVRSSFSYHDIICGNLKISVR